MVRRGRSNVLAVFTLVALVGSVSGLSARAATQDDDTATITVHLRICEEVAPDGNYYPTCHDNGASGYTVGAYAHPDGVGAVAEGTTDAEGNVTLSVPPGAYSVQGPPGHFTADIQIVCSPTDTPATPIGFPVTVAAGDAVTCDYYIVPTTFRGDDPADGDKDDGSDQAPAARPAAIHAGTCADPGDTVADLTSVSAPDGAPAGADDALPVESSFTRLDQPLDEFLAEAHLIAVFSPDDPEAMVACGPVGGIVAEDGTLALGLAEVDGSGLAGIAYLAPDGEQTLVTIFLAG